eukprot:s658_g22.t1
MLALEDWKDDERPPPAPVKEAPREENQEDDAVAATLAALRSKTSSKVAEPTAEEKEPRMKRPAAALRRPAAAKVKIHQTDAEPAGPAPLGTSDVEKEVVSLQKAKKQKKDSDSSKLGVGEQIQAREDNEVSLPSTGRKGLKGNSPSTAMTPTSTRRGSRVAERMKRPASKKIPTGKSAMDSLQIVREPQSASASSALRWFLSCKSMSHDLQWRQGRNMDVKRK